MKRRLPVIPQGLKINRETPRLPWVTRGDGSTSGTYRIVRSIRGFELWDWSTSGGCIGREIATLEKAKELAERHAQKQKETA